MIELLISSNSFCDADQANFTESTYNGAGFLVVRCGRSFFPPTFKSGCWLLCDAAGDGRRLCFEAVWRGLFTFPSVCESAPDCTDVLGLDFFAGLPLLGLWASSDPCSTWATFRSRQCLTSCRGFPLTSNPTLILTWDLDSRSTMGNGPQYGA